MNILQVSSSYRPAWSTGGTARFVTQLSEQLVEEGHNVTVLTTDRGNPRLDEKTNQPIDVNGVSVYYLKNLSNFIATKIKLVTPYASPVIANRIMENFDVVHIHEHRTSLAAITSYYARKYNIPYVIQEHGSLGVNRGRTSLKKSFDSLMGNRVLSEASSFIAQTETEKSEFVDWGIDPDEINVIPLAISESELETTPRGPSLAARCGVEDSTPIILYLGRLHSIKGVDKLIESLPLVQDAVNSDVQLAIVGPDDGDEQRLRDIAAKSTNKESIHFLGPLYGGEKCRAYSGASVYVLPSKYESFPTTVLEAGLFETPSAISNRCSNSQLLKKNGAVVVFERNKEDLSKRIAEILGDEGISKELIKNTQSLIRNELSWEFVSDQIVGVYCKTA
jgi:glycosyltransferase involved in cell wall biosynthesis